MPTGRQRHPGANGFSLLAVSLLACSPAPDVPAAKPDDSVWIAAVGVDGALDLLARYSGGAWENPRWMWTADTSEVAPVTSVDGVWRWPGGDTLATGVPVRWYLYSESQQGTLLETTGARWAQRKCLWELTTGRRDLSAHQASRFAGLALSRPPETVLSEMQILELDRITAKVGLRNSRWLGFFGMDGSVFGLIHGLYPRGGLYLLIEIDGETDPVLTATDTRRC